MTAPGPSGGQMLRAIPAIRRDPLGFLARMRAEHGDVLQLPIPRPPTYVVTEPDAVRRVLVTNAKGYGKDTLQYSALSLVTGEGLLTADTEAWRPQRRLVQPAFHRESLELVAGHVRRSVDRLLTSWASCDGAVVDVDAAMMRLALEVVGASLFGADLSDDADRLTSATLRALDVVLRKARAPLPIPARFPTPTNVVLRRAVHDLDVAVAAMLDERLARPLRAGGPPRDMLDLLLAGHGREGALSRRQVRDQVVTFIVAGHETVASALTWAWHLLAQNPGSCARLRAEADAVPAGGPTFDDVPRLPYATAVLDEVLRLYPPAWLVTRRSLEPDVLAGVEVPGGSLVIVSPWLVHRHEASWPDPEAFRPERFLDAGGSRRRDVVTSAAYLPFGAGPRQCIGRDMALLEGVLVLSALAARVELCDVGVPVRVRPVVTLRPEHGLPLRVRLRSGARAHS
jgi:cytochrome P450